jgi:hypothetical protein
MTELIDLINNITFAEFVTYIIGVFSVSFAFFKLFIEGKIKSQQKQIDDLKNLNLNEQNNIYKTIMTVLFYRLQYFNHQIQNNGELRNIPDNEGLREAELKNQMIIFAHFEILALYIKQEKLYLKNDMRFFKYFFDMIILIRQRLFKENQINSIVLASIFIKGETQNHYKEMGYSDEDITYLNNTSQLKTQFSKQTNSLKNKRNQ